MTERFMVRFSGRQTPSQIVEASSPKELLQRAVQACPSSEDVELIMYSGDQHVVWNHERWIRGEDNGWHAKMLELAFPTLAQESKAHFQPIFTPSLPQIPTLVALCPTEVMSWVIQLKQPGSTLERIVCSEIEASIWMGSVGWKSECFPNVFPFVYWR
jgi:hypothetical protein